MLPEPLRLLISAYAIGELSPRRRSAAVRLLRHSAEARRLLKDLKANRRRLRALANPQLPNDFTAWVVHGLPERSPIIRPSFVAIRDGSRSRRAAPAVIAAASFVAVAVGAYLLGSLPRQSAGNPPVASRPSAKADAADAPFVNRNSAAEQPVSVEPVQPITEETAVAKNPRPIPQQPALPPAADPLGTITLPPPQLTKVDPPQLLSLMVRDLDSSDHRQKFQRELSQAEVHHVDLFCKDSVRAFERLQAAMRGRGVKLNVDVVAVEALKRKVRSQLLVFCDELSAAEWTQVLQAVAAADMRAGDALFDHVVVLPFDNTDRRELTATFGVDLSQPEVRRTGAGGKKEARQAFAAALAPWRTSATSRDVRQFLDAHHNRADGTIVVLLVLRMPGS